MNLDRMFQAGLALAAVGVVWSVWPQPGLAAYTAVNRVRHSAYHRGPAVLIDRAHWNRSSADPRFEGLDQLLAWDGYRVSRNDQEFVPELLKTTRILVVADAMGWRGAVQSAAHSLGVDARLHPHAFAPSEIAAVREWVGRGGSLLLMADRTPSGEASQDLAGAFGARLADCPASAGRSLIWFDHEGGLGQDPISSGEGERDEPVTFAMSFGGGDLIGPPGAMTILKVNPKSVLPTGADSPCVPATSQGVALESGKGRVVILTGQLARADGLAQKAGINDRITDNRQLVLNIMHWLSRAR